MSRSKRSSKLVFTPLLCALALALVAASPAEPPAGVDPWETGGVAVPEAGDDHVVGRVVGLAGEVYAQSPGGEKRLLSENAVIYPGDRLVTSKGATLGVLSGEYYTGLDENTTLTYAQHGTGAPEVNLERGQVRMINAGDGASPRIATPGMTASNTGSDTAAYAIPEKAWIVSMICALEGQAEVVAGGGSMVVAEGGCAAFKPADGLYAAGAAGAPLPLVAAAAAAAAASAAGAGGGAPLGGPAAARFAGPDVGTPPNMPLAQNFRPPINSPFDDRTPREPCDVGAAACTQTATAANPIVVGPPWPGFVPGRPPPVP